MALFSYDRQANQLTVNLPSIRIARPARTKATASELAYILNLDEDNDEHIRVRSPYSQISWVNIAVTKIAQHLMRARFELLRGGDVVVESGKTYDLFRDVNPFFSRAQLWEATTSWLMMRGEAFWLPVPGEALTDAIYVVHPQAMKERVSEAGDITLWQYKPEHTSIPYTPDEIVHFKLWNPWNTRRGMNPLKAQDLELRIDLSATHANLSMLENGAVLDAILSSDNPYMDEDQAKQLKDRWERDHKGAKKQHGISVLHAGTKYQPIQMSPEDMAYFKLKQWSRESILARYGVPSVVAGATDDRSPLSGKDTEEQMRLFWEGTIDPILRFYEDKLDTEFFARFGLPEIGRFNTDHISELQEDRTAQYERQRADVTAGIRTINEIRESRGMNPVPWGNTWWLPLTLAPYDEAPTPPAKMDHVEWWKVKPIAELMAPKSAWNAEYKEMHWKRITKTWAKTEAAYRKDLKDWVFDIRSRTLHLMTREKAPSNDLIDEIMDDAWWATSENELRTMTNRYYREAAQAAEPHIRDVLLTTGVELTPSWSIFNTTAVQMLDARLEKISRVNDTIKEETRTALKKSVEDGLTDQEAAERITGLYNQAKTRCNAIARTEIGGSVNDAEVASYIDTGFTLHSWLQTFDDDVRETHRLDETVTIGERFSNGLRWPGDPEGAAEETINCRCLTLPEKGK